MRALTMPLTSPAIPTSTHIPDPKQVRKSSLQRVVYGSGAKPRQPLTFSCHETVMRLDLERRHDARYRQQTREHLHEGIIQTGTELATFTASQAHPAVPIVMTVKKAYDERSVWPLLEYIRDSVRDNTCSLLGTLNDGARAIRLGTQLCNNISMTYNVDKKSD